MSEEPSELREYLIYFAQIHETFRKPELDSLSQLAGVGIEWKEYSDVVSILLARKKRKEKKRGNWLIIFDFSPGFTVTIRNSPPP